MKEELMTLQELTDKLQTLCHSGHAQKTIVLSMCIDGQLSMCIDGQLYMSIPYKNDESLIISEESIGINFGKFRRKI